MARTIQLHYFNSQFDSEFLSHVVHNSLRSKIFKGEDGIIYIFSKRDTQWDSLNFNMLKVELNENLANQITKLIYDSHKKVHLISTSNPKEEQDYSIQFKGKIEIVVESLVNKYSYDDNNKGILEFISILLIRIARAHAWHNGNKRTAIISIHKILESFGYFIKWSNANDMYIREWEQLMYQISGKNETEDARLLSEAELVEIVKGRLQSNIWLNADKCI